MQPKHLGVIMDGNRRWARAQGMEPWEGHQYGAETFERFLDWMKELGLKEATFYTFSTENFKRSKKEVDVLFSLLKKLIKRHRHDQRIRDYKVKVRFVGRLHLFPEDMQKEMYAFMDETAHHEKHILNFAMGYGGRAELTDTIKELVDAAREGLEPDQIDEAFIQERLWLKNDIDMVIRTGGAQRTSNFFPWQTVYAEWFFVDTYWPAFTKSDLSKCLEAFAQRERRVGK